MKSKMLTYLTLYISSLLFFSCDNTNDKDYEEVKTTYKNPVVNYSLPDPTIIQTPDGWFYLYATEDIGNMPIMKSKDLINWTYVKTVFTNETRPDFVKGGGLWAPDINYINGKYVLYYSMSTWGGVNECGIGIAICDIPDGSFEDLGKLFISKEIGVTNSIDPFYIEDDGKKYLFWGSFYGIYGIELNEDGLSVKEGAEKVKVAGSAFEATYIHKRDDYYYFFASVGSCCEGLNSTYRNVVGRSKSLFGPYVDKNNKSMLNNGYSLVIGSNDSFVGNGHNSEIVQDKEGNDWILYHGVSVRNPEGRVLLLDQIKWDEEGWPYIEENSPSVSSSVPVF